MTLEAVKEIIRVTKKKSAVAKKKVAKKKATKRKATTKKAAAKTKAEMEREIYETFFSKEELAEMRRGAIDRARRKVLWELNAEVDKAARAWLRAHKVQIQQHVTDTMETKVEKEIEKLVAQAIKRVRIVI